MRNFDKSKIIMQFLSHIKVLELATVLAGPAVGMFFAELGAKVIKVEPPGGDVTRSWKLPIESKDDTVSAYFSSVNYGKESLFMDLSVPEERQKLYDLIENEHIDIVIANFKKGSAEKLGLDYDTLSKLQPSLIYGHITGYGTGSDRTGFDAVIQAESGFMYLNRLPGKEPTKMPVALMDLLAAHQLKEGLLLALYQRERTGRGAYVHVSLIQAAVSALANQASAWLKADSNPQPMGSDHPTIAPYGSLFFTKDGKYILLAVGNDAQFRNLCQSVNLPELAKDIRFQSNPERVKHREVLKNMFSEAIREKDAATWISIFHRRQIPCGVIQDIREALKQPEVADLLLTHAVRTIAFEVNGQPLRNNLSEPQPLI
jgi:crotonobetainyl-CoA:carnitine CoA-transferase CaiB-like acyl-CoA transferase